MTSIEYNQVRKGMVIVGADGQLYYVVDRYLNTLGTWLAHLKLKLKSLETGAVTENKVRPDDKVQQAALERRDMQYVYQDGDGYVFMDLESNDQVTLPCELLGEQMKYLKENNGVGVTFYDGKPLSVELPATVELKVVETEPASTRATAAASKLATLETGLKLQVPPFITVGEVIAVNTRSGEYLGRAR